MRDLLAELRRRRVFRVAGVYVVGGVAVAQAADTLLPRLGLPDWTVTLVVVLVLLGLPLAVGLAWAFDITPRGIERSSADPIAPPASFRMVLVTAVVLSAILGVAWFVRAGNDSTEHSVAVLPLCNRSTDPQDAFYADGVHDQIVMQLGRIDGLRVISTTSVRSYRDADLSLKQVGRELGVRHIVEGCVQRAGGGVLVTARLVDAETDRQLWGESYRGTLADVFAFQSDIAQRIVTALRSRLTHDEKERLSHVATTSAEAYEYYLRALSPIATVGGEGLRSAILLLERAVALDSTFALAHARLAQAHAGLVHQQVDATPQRRALALSAAQAALRHAPDLGEARLGMVWYWYHAEKDYRRALDELDAVEQRLPGSSEVILLRALIDRRLGRWADARDRLRRAATFDPRSTLVWVSFIETVETLGDFRASDSAFATLAGLEPEVPNWQVMRTWVLLARGELDSASTRLAALPPTWDENGEASYARFTLALLRRQPDEALRALARSPFPVALSQLFYEPMQLMAARAHHLAGRSADARAAADSARDHLEHALLSSPRDARMRAALAEAHALGGNATAARRDATLAVELMPFSRDALIAGRIQYNAAAALALAGDNAAAMSLLEQALAGAHFRGVSRPVARLDHRFDALRADPRFQRIVAAVTSPRTAAAP